MLKEDSDLLLDQFIEQQKQIIIYYEEAVKPKQNEEKGKK